MNTRTDDQQQLTDQAPAIEDQALREAIRRLSRPQRLAFEMVAAGANASDIAAALQCSRLGAQRIVSKARWQIRMFLKSSARLSGRRGSSGPVMRKKHNLTKGRGRD